MEFFVAVSNNRRAKLPILSLSTSPGFAEIALPVLTILMMRQTNKFSHTAARKDGNGGWASGCSGCGILLMCKRITFGFTNAIAFIVLAVLTDTNLDITLAESFIYFIY